jgi:hypothetical protein
MAAVPVNIRAAVSDQLDRLVRGDYPDLLVWVQMYGGGGTTLTAQPNSIFEHGRTDAIATLDDGWHIVVPLFTTDESPSELSAELVVDRTGTARITDVRVLSARAMTTDRQFGEERSRDLPRSVRVTVMARYLVGNGDEVIGEMEHSPEHGDRLLR